MTTKTRSEIPCLPPLKTPPRHTVSRSFHKSETPLLSLVPVAHSTHHITSGNHDLESRVSTLEQANKMLLEEIINARANTHATWFNHSDNPSFDRHGNEMGVAKSSLGMDPVTVSHIIKQSSETDKRVYLIQNQLDQLMEVIQRTREDTYEYHRDTNKELGRRIKSLEKRFIGFEDHYITLQSNNGDQKEVWSRQLADLSTTLSNQIKSGAKAVTDLQRGLEAVETIIHNLSGNISQTDIVTTHLQAIQNNTQHMIQTRFDELWRTVREVQVRLSNIESLEQNRDTWLAQSFGNTKERISKLSVNTSSVLKLLSADFERIEKELNSQGNMIETTIAEMKKERLLKEDKLQNEINQIREESLKTIPTLNEITTEITRTKEAFEENKKHFVKSVSSFSVAISLMEKESRFAKQELTKVMEAEIKTRREESLCLQQYCSSIIGNSTECLKLSLATLENRTTENYTELTDTIKTTTNELRDGQRRLLTDIGTRLSSLHVREQERDLLVERVKNINEQVINITKQLRDSERLQYNDNDTSEVQRINIKVSENSNQLHGLARNLQEIQIQMKLASQLQTESTKRFQEVMEVRNELAWVQSRLTAHYPTITTAPVSSSAQKHVTINNVTIPQVISPTPEPHSPTPEPHSIQSSPSLAHKWKRSRRGRGTSHVMYAQEPTETMGTFTSAAPTPIELRNILGNEHSDYLDTDVTGDGEEASVVNGLEEEGVVNELEEEGVANELEEEGVVNEQNDDSEEEFGNDDLLTNEQLNTEEGVSGGEGLGNNDNGQEDDKGMSVVLKENTELGTSDSREDNEDRFSNQDGVADDETHK